MKFHLSHQREAIQVLLTREQVTIAYSKQSNTPLHKRLQNQFPRPFYHQLHSRFLSARIFQAFSRTCVDHSTHFLSCPNTLPSCVLNLCNSYHPPQNRSLLHLHNHIF